MGDFLSWNRFHPIPPRHCGGTIPESGISSKTFLKQQQTRVGIAVQFKTKSRRSSGRLVVCVVVCFGTSPVCRAENYGAISGAQVGPQVDSVTGVGLTTAGLHTEE